MVQPVLQNELTDEELFDQFRCGNTGSFENLVRRYEGELFGYLNRYLRNRTLAEDVFQNCFLQVYQKAVMFEKGRPFRPWLYSIATHLAIDETRRNKRRATVGLEGSPKDHEERTSLLDQLASNDARPDHLAQEEEKREQVRNAIESMPDTLKQVLILAYYQEFKYQEIAEVLQIPLGTVKSRMHTALEKFQEAWSRLQAESEKGR